MQFDVAEPKSKDLVDWPKRVVDAPEGLAAGRRRYGLCLEGVESVAVISR